MLAKIDDFSDNVVQIYRACFEGDQPDSEFAFAESMYSEGKL